MRNLIYSFKLCLSNEYRTVTKCSKDVFGLTKKFFLDVRLVGGATKYEGQVELYKFGKWINVCSDDLNAKLAAVVCRSLGFPW